MNDKRYSLPKEFGEKWIEALESGKYERGSCALKDGSEFCCLGVACDIVGIKNISGGICSDMQEDKNYHHLPDLLKGNIEDSFISEITSQNDFHSTDVKDFSAVVKWIRNNVEFI